MGNTNTVLVLGATGGIGGEVARQLQGWRLGRPGTAATRRAAHREAQGNHVVPWRRTQRARCHEGGKRLFSHCSCGQSTRVPALVGARTADAGQQHRSRNGVAGNHRIAGDDLQFRPGRISGAHGGFPAAPCDTQRRHSSRDGRRLRAASNNGARVLIVRAGDFFGPKAGNNWFSQGLIQPGKPVRTIRNPGRTGVGHQWSYLPDVARTMVELLARRDSLQPFATFHMAGHWDADGSQMSESIQRVVAHRSGQAPRISAFPWWLLSLLSPFVATFREMREMRYLWRTPIRMDNSRLNSVLGKEPHTPLDEAVEATLIGLGSLSPTQLPAAPLHRA